MKFDLKLTAEEVYKALNRYAVNKLREKEIYSSVRVNSELFVRNNGVSHALVKVEILEDEE